MCVVYVCLLFSCMCTGVLSCAACVSTHSSDGRVSIEQLHEETKAMVEVCGCVCVQHMPCLRVRAPCVCVCFSVCVSAPCVCVRAVR